jgi:hypothetical protein
MIKIETFLVIAGIIAFFYSLFDCARTEQEQVRGLPKWAWLLLLILNNVGLLVPIAWFVWGRQRVSPSRKSSRGKKPRIVPPDDDPDFLRKL